MNVSQRIRMCRMIEKMKGKEDVCQRLGLADVSRFKTNEKNDSKDEKKEEE